VRLLGMLNFGAPLQEVTGVPQRWVSGPLVRLSANLIYYPLNGPENDTEATHSNYV
jgi:hypothetical protein